MINWIKHYTPATMACWQGRAHAAPESYFFQNLQLLNLQQQNIIPEKKPTFGLLGFCCDAGIQRNSGRIGAATGPMSIREVLAKLPYPRQDVRCFDAGDITCYHDDLENAQAALAKAVALLLTQNITPIVLGGGHELAWGHYQGIATKFPHETLAIVNFDAHYDLRVPPHDRGNSGTSFWQIAQAHEHAKRDFNYNCIGIVPSANTKDLLATATKYKTNTIFTESLHQGETQACEALIQTIITDNTLLYVSLCLDVFATPYAPGVSAPQILGLTPWQVLPHLKKLVASGKVISYDIAELSPPFDLDQRTAKLAAQLIYEIIKNHGVS